MNGPGGFELGTDGPTVILIGVDGSQTSLRPGAYAAGLAQARPQPVSASPPSSSSPTATRSPN